MSTARHNALRYPAAGEIHFVRSNWLAGFRPSPCFDLIVSNPPYIVSNEIARLQPEIHRYEPRLALDGGRDGLDACRAIISNALSCLTPGGQLLLEIGFDQAEAVRKIAERQPRFRTVTVHPDYSGKARVVQIETKCDPAELP